ncbi:membrin-11-like [Primulina huaijiensis]|uniref:membrin-11-like n=1 Tax=Primulina huaijiensis TaxID=1492673 RepID=UPI003CC7339B
MEVEGGGGTLSELYSSSKRLLLRTRDALERLERLEYSSSSSSSSTAVIPGVSDDQSTAVRRDINQIQTLCSDMDRHWRSIAAKSQRDLWKRKVEQVSEEAESLRASLDKYLSRHQKRIQEAQERAELFGRANGDSHILRIFDEEAQASESVRRSSQLLEDTFATGVAILSKYSEQREHLKRAQRKALDVLNTLGLSNSLLRLIERRNRVDKWIKYAGMVFTVVVIFIFWRWTR